MDPAIETCLRAEPSVPPRHQVAEWWPRWRDGSARAASPAGQARLGGFDADRVGWAFAADYQAALRALLPDLPSGVVAALCVTEDDDNRPRDIPEDVHVSLAVCAYLLREARHRHWPAAFVERLCAVIAALAGLAGAPATAAPTHIALAGTLAWAYSLYAEAGTLWSCTAQAPAALRWQRDAALFDVAGSAAGRRTARAWQTLQATAPM